MKNETIKTGSGSVWNLHEDVRTSLMTINKELGYFPICKLTGKFNDHKRLNGEIWSELEVLDQYGEGGFINEQFISQ